MEWRRRQLGPEAVRGEAGRGGDTPAVGSVGVDSSGLRQLAARVGRGARRSGWNRRGRGSTAGGCHLREEIEGGTVGGEVDKVCATGT